MSKLLFAMLFGTSVSSFQAHAQTQTLLNDPASGNHGQVSPSLQGDQAEISRSVTVSLTCKNFNGDAFIFNLKLPAPLAEGGYPVVAFESRYAIDRVADNNGTDELLRVLKLVAQDFTPSQEDSSTPIYFIMSSESSYYKGAPGPDFHKYITGYGGEFRTKSIPSPVNPHSFLVSINSILKVEPLVTQTVRLNHNIMTGIRYYWNSSEPVICKFSRF